MDILEIEEGACSSHLSKLTGHK